MPLAYCPIDCDNDAHAWRMTSTTADQGAAPSTAVLEAGGDTGPQPAFRGTWRGRAPDYLLAELRASAASGAGLALMPGTPAARPSLVLPILALAVLALAVRSRSS